jgi:hypothetical protein
MVVNLLAVATTFSVAGASASTHRVTRHTVHRATARPRRRRRSRTKKRARGAPPQVATRRAASHPAAKPVKRPAPAKPVTKPVTNPAAPVVAPVTPVSAPRPIVTPDTPVSAPTPPIAPANPITAPVSAPVSAPAPTLLPSGQSSAWAEPALVNPIAVALSDTNRNLTLSQTRDYVLVCPPGQLSLTYALSVWGGHNVELENCDFNITTADWAAHLKNQTGTLYLRNVHFGGALLTGGIQLQEPGATTVVMRDVLFDTVHGSYTTNHAECVQTWSGPQRLLIDGLTCPTQYQGLFLLPNQSDSTTVETAWDLRNISIDDTDGAYALWLGDVTGSPANQADAALSTWSLSNVFVDPNPSRTWTGWWLWPKPSTGDATWSGVQAGVPPGGPYVTAVPGGATGPDETTAPGALAGEQP